MQFLDNLFRDHPALAVLLSGAGVVVIGWLFRHLFKRKGRDAGNVSVSDKASIGGPVVATRDQSGGNEQVAQQIVNVNAQSPPPAPAAPVLRLIHEEEAGARTSGHFPVAGRIEREWREMVEFKVMISVENVGNGAVRDLAVDVSPPPAFAVHPLPPDTGPADATVRKVDATTTRITTKTGSVLRAKMKLPFAYARREFRRDRDDIQDANFTCTLYGEGVPPVTERFLVSADTIRRHIGAAPSAPIPSPSKVVAEEKKVIGARSQFAATVLTDRDNEQENARKALVAAVEPFLGDATLGDDAIQVHNVLTPTLMDHWTGSGILVRHAEELLKKLAARPDLAVQHERFAKAWKEFRRVYS